MSVVTKANTPSPLNRTTWWELINITLKVLVLLDPTCPHYCNRQDRREYRLSQNSLLTYHNLRLIKIYVILRTI